MRMTRTVAFRPLTHSDAAFAAEAEAVMDPLHAWHGTELLEMWSNTEAGAKAKRFAVQVDGVDFGWISLIKPRDSAGDAVWLNLIVPGQDEDVMEAAIAFGEAEAVELQPALLLSPVWESQVAARHVLQRRGYELKRKERFWRLDLPPNAARLIELRAAARRRVEGHGLKLATAAEVGGEAIYPQLHMVSEATKRDIPSTTPITPMPYAVWLTWLTSTGMFKDRIWVAVSNGRPVGYSYLIYRPSLVETGYTGVLSEVRNRGVARALKLETLVQAIDLGVQVVETENDFENAPILHLNQELGYQLVASKLEFAKTV